jgi:hypothetical protein
MIYMELVPSSLIGLSFTFIGIVLVLIRVKNPSLSRGATL